MASSLFASPHARMLGGEHDYKQAIRQASNWLLGLDRILCKKRFELLKTGARSDIIINNFTLSKTELNKNTTKQNKNNKTK